jgi:hypothetical protein
LQRRERAYGIDGSEETQRRYTAARYNFGLGELFLNQVEVWAIR